MDKLLRAKVSDGGREVGQARGRQKAQRHKT